MVNMSGKGVLSKFKIVSFLLFFVFLFSIKLFSQTDHKINLYQAYINDRMDSFLIELKNMESEYAKNKKIELLMEITTTQYAVIGYNMGMKNYKIAEEYLNKADVNCDALLKTNPKWSEAHAIKGALLGFRIGLSNFKALYLGYQCINSINKAISLNGNEPLGWLEKGNMYNYAPSIYGGAKKKAISYYQTAIYLFEQTKTDKNNWNYLNTHAIMGRCYEKLEQYEQAKMMYEKVLKVEPNYRWVRDGLYPDLLKKMKK